MRVTGLRYPETAARPLMRKFSLNPPVNSIGRSQCLQAYAEGGSGLTMGNLHKTIGLNKHSRLLSSVRS